MNAALHIATDADAPTLAGHVKQLQSQVRALAGEHVAALQEALATVASLSREIAAGGDAYHVGVREIAVRLSDDAEAKRLTIKSIQSRIR